MEQTVEIRVSCGSAMQTSWEQDRTPAAPTAQDWPERSSWSHGQGPHGIAWINTPLPHTIPPPHTHTQITYIWLFEGQWLSLQPTMSTSLLRKYQYKMFWEDSLMWRDMGTFLTMLLGNHITGWKCSDLIIMTICLLISENWKVLPIMQGKVLEQQQ